jgi:hypothetical protein
MDIEHLQRHEDGQARDHERTGHARYRPSGWGPSLRACAATATAAKMARMLQAGWK